MPKQAKDVRLSGPSLRLLKVFVDKPTVGFSGAEIAKQTSLGSGTLYPILARFEEAGWLKSEWEKIDPSEAGRPRRRIYRITGQGQNRAAQALAELQTAPGALAWN